MILNGVDLDQEAEGKWWGFTFTGPPDPELRTSGHFLAGWCMPEHRAELIESVTGVTYLRRMDAGATPRVEYRGEDEEGVLDNPTLPDGVMTIFPQPDSGYTLLGFEMGTRRWEWASIFWGDGFAGGPNRFAFSFTLVQHLPPGVVDSGGNIGDLGGVANVLLDIPSDEAGAAIYAAVIDTAGGTLGVEWQPDDDDPGTRESFTEIDSNTVSGIRVSLWRLLDPTPTIDGASFVRFTDSAAQERLVHYWYMTDVDQLDPDDAPVFSSGTGTASSLSIPGGGVGDVALNVAGWWVANQSGMGNPTAGGGQTSDYASFIDRPFGQPDAEGGAGHGSAGPTWTWSSSQPWVAGGIVVHSG